MSEPIGIITAQAFIANTNRPLGDYNRDGSPSFLHRLMNIEYKSLDHAVDEVEREFDDSKEVLAAAASRDRLWVNWATFYGCKSAEAFIVWSEDDKYNFDCVGQSHCHIGAQFLPLSERLTEYLSPWNDEAKRYFKTMYGESLMDEYLAEREDNYNEVNKGRKAVEDALATHDATVDHYLNAYYLVNEISEAV